MEPDSDVSRCWSAFVCSLSRSQTSEKLEKLPQSAVSLPQTDREVSPVPGQSARRVPTCGPIGELRWTQKGAALRAHGLWVSDSGGSASPSVRSDETGSAAPAVTRARPRKRARGFRFRSRPGPGYAAVSTPGVGLQRTAGAVSPPPPSSSAVNAGFIPAAPDPVLGGLPSCRFPLQP